MRWTAGRMVAVAVAVAGIGVGPGCIPEVPPPSLICPAELSQGQSSLQAYKAERSVYPASVTELTPDYMPYLLSDVRWTYTALYSPTIEATGYALVGVGDCVAFGVTIPPA
jgi:hypothetical protein